MHTLTEALQTPLSRMGNLEYSSCGMHLLMNDSHGARIHAQTAQERLGVRNDRVLDQCIIFLDKSEKECMKVYVEEDVEKDYILPLYRRPEQYIIATSQSSDLIALELRWQSMQDKHDGFV
jgi:hypothetical protein